MFASYHRSFLPRTYSFAVDAGSSRSSQDSIMAESHLNSDGQVLYQLSYFSKECGDFDKTSLDMLRDQASAFNELSEITGLLMYKNGYFVQIIEGSKEELNKLYTKIENDERHNIIRSKVLKKIKKRSFIDWSMKVIETDIDLRKVRKIDHDAYYLLIYFKNYFSI